MMLVSFRRCTRSEGLQVIARQIGRTTGDITTLLDPNKTHKYTLQHMAKAAIATESKAMLEFIIRTLKTPINEYFEGPQAPGANGAAGDQRNKGKPFHKNTDLMTPLELSLLFLR